MQIKKVRLDKNYKYIKSAVEFLNFINSQFSHFMDIIHLQKWSTFSVSGLAITGYSKILFDM